MPKFINNQEKKKREETTMKLNPTVKSPQKQKKRKKKESHKKRGAEAHVRPTWHHLTSPKKPLCLCNYSPTPPAPPLSTVIFHRHLNGQILPLFPPYDLHPTPTNRPSLPSAFHFSPR